MSANKLWQDIVKGALVGSDRQALSLPAGGVGPLPELLAQVKTESQEAYLLQVAGTVAVHQRAGARSVPLDLIAPAPSETEDLPICSPLARRLLGRLLSGEHQEIFPAWLELAATAGQRVPPEFLPQLLDRGKQDAELRPKILLVLGKRGQWLAAHNPDWDYAAAIADAQELDLEIWQTGSKAARLALLRELRRQDPEKARELVVSTWKSEKADIRTAQLQMLAHNLSMADEPWLETVLDDRSKQVRGVCTTLLAQLPESQLCQRAIARVAPLLKLEDSHEYIAVELPAGHDAAMERDGILPKPPQKMGEKAWWLQQMLGIVPPSYWAQKLQASPQVLLRSIEPKWQEVFMEGWATAAMRHRDEAWAEELLQPDFYPFLSGFADLVVSTLPRERQQQACLRLLQESTKNPSLEADRFPAFELLQHCEGPWSIELIDTAIAYFTQLFKAKPKNIYQYQYQLRNVLTALALCFPKDAMEKGAEVAKKIEQAIEAAQYPYYLDQHLKPFVSLLEFRQQLHQAF